MGKLPGSCPSQTRQKKESLALPRQAGSTRNNPTSAPIHTKRKEGDTVPLSCTFVQMYWTAKRTAWLKRPSFWQHRFPITNAMHREFVSRVPFSVALTSKESRAVWPFHCGVIRDSTFSQHKLFLWSLQPVRFPLKITLSQDVTRGLSNARLLTPTHGLSIFSLSTDTLSPESHSRARVAPESWSTSRWTQTRIPTTECFLHHRLMDEPVPSVSSQWRLCPSRYPRLGVARLSQCPKLGGSW